MSTERRWLALAIGVLIPTAAHAGDGLRDRTPVLWNDVPCATLVDRSATPTFNVAYDVPMDDTEVTADEVADGRRHQFFAFCRDPGIPPLPKWITQADLDAADAVGLIPEGARDDVRILADDSEWTDCWFRINADDDRRPITMQQAAMGVDWAVTDVPAGTYWLAGYVWDPFYNDWFLRPGFVKLHDGDPGALPPAVAVTSGEMVIYKDECGVVEGCVDAIEGASITAYFSPVVGEPDWTELVAEEPVAGTSFQIAFAPPEAIAGQTVMLRVDVTDPRGRTNTAYGRETLIVLPGTNPGGCDGGGIIDNPDCDEDEKPMCQLPPEPDDDSGDTGPVGDGGTTTGGPPMPGTGEGSTGVMQDGGDDGTGRGCACTSAPDRAPALVLVVGLGLIGLRRRRSMR